ncbi:MAG: flippase [Chloroflexi bacterium]|nr:flippase [Chloroflexota bacterium]
MNPTQRLFSNTALAFVTRIIAKFSDVLLFIIIGRMMGPEQAGVFRLGKTYLTLALAFSAWGLDDLLVREAAPRRNSSNQYLVNFMALRLVLALGAFVLLAVGVLGLPLPYSQQAIAVILIYSLAIFAEAAYVLFESIFIAYEKLGVPTLAAVVNGGVKLFGGVLLLMVTQNVVTTAWIIPIGSTLSLFVFVPALMRLYRTFPQELPTRFSLRFTLEQLRQIPGFIMIGIFYNINAQQDTFLVSLYLSETELGYYGAAQTLLMGILMLSAAVRTAVYPLMARYHTHSPDKLPRFYHKLYQYITIGILPITVVICVLAGPIITLIFTDSFAPAAPALALMIWEVFFTFLHIPNARLMLVNNRQKQLGWITGLSMLFNLGLNLWLLPLYGIYGPAFARPLAAFLAFWLTNIYVQRRLMPNNLLPILLRPIVASGLMALVMWPLRQQFILIPILVGGLAYGGVILITGAFTVEDRVYLKQLFARNRPINEIDP